MPEDKNVPQKPTADSNPPPPQSGAGHIDLGKVLLPKKPVPGATTDSAERVNAGALLEQEQKATLTPTPPPKTPAPPPQPKKEEGTMIPPLQTFQGDIESLIQKTNASTVSIAAAEAARRSKEPVAPEAPVRKFDWQNLLRRMTMIVGGAVFITAAAVMLFFVYDRFYATVPIPEDAAAPFITVDHTEAVSVPPGDLQRTTLMGTLEAARASNDLSLGLMGRLAVFQATPSESEEDTYTPLDAQTLLPVLAPNIPPELIRSLTGTYLLGVHTYDGTQAFLLFEVDSYERAFAAMLAWERTMRGDLLPLFNREPRERIPEEGVATSSVGSVPQLIQTGFSDKIIENRDTRAVLNTWGDVLLLWAPLSQNLFVITTNEYTLKEIVSRLGL